MIKKVSKIILEVLGLSVYDFYLWNATRRKYWFRPFGAKIKIPKIELTFPPTIRIAEDIELCKRLISAYHKSMRMFENSRDVAPTWDIILNRYYEKLNSCLEKKDAKALAEN